MAMPCYESQLQAVLAVQAVKESSRCPSRRGLRAACLCFQRLRMAWGAGTQASLGVILTDLSHAVLAMRTQELVLSQIPDICIFDEGKEMPCVVQWECLQQYSTKGEALLTAYVGFHVALCRLAPAQGTSIASSALCGSAEITVGSMMLLLDQFASVLLQNCMDVFTRLHADVRREAWEQQDFHPELSAQHCCKAVLDDPAKHERSVRVSKRVGPRAMVSTIIMRFNLLLFFIFHACPSYLFGQKGLGAAQVAMGVVASVLINAAFDKRCLNASTTAYPARARRLRAMVHQITRQHLLWRVLHTLTTRRTLCNVLKPI